jgi:phytoene synthase
MTADTLPMFRQTIQHHSKSFAFASALIPGEARHHVEVLYTWCRRADDAIDLAAPAAQEGALADLHRELDQIYVGTPCADELTTAMQQLIRDFDIPKHYPRELLAGMAMDTRGTDYDSLNTLLLYCYRVAGTVGLMMSHVLGVRRPEALQHAVHLGIAMQLTNICRDVKEDWDRGRLYIPREVLTRHGAGDLPARLGEELAENCRLPLARSVSELLTLADRYYASADAGMRSLPWRAAVAVRAARHIYADIGAVIRRNQCDIFHGRAVVPKRRKYVLGCRAFANSVLDVPFCVANPFIRAPLTTPLRFPDDVLLLENVG